MRVEQLEWRARSHLYLLAARLFMAEVDIDLYGVLTRPPMEELLGLTCSTGARRPAPEEAVEEMAVEFCRLFIGPRPLCPPYASIQRGEALIGGRSARLLDQFMEAHNLRVEAPSHLPMLAVDHLGVELALLALLYESAAAGTAVGGHDDPITSVRALLEDHLLPWAPEYLAGMGGWARTPYDGLGRFTAALLQDERGLHSLG
ncbi:MAG: molecular chaperone TorD family protein [Actinomycetota bacterium]|jgi:TorA maturation chaperone TorD|nr:molecular chaperone TorD family protein [Actinomycetota bacterium]